MEKKSKKKGPKEASKKVIVFYADKYLPWQEAALRILQEIGFDEEFKIKEKPLDRLKNEESLKPFFKDVMKFANFIITEVEED